MSKVIYFTSESLCEWLNLPITLKDSERLEKLHPVRLEIDKLAGVDKSW